MHKKIVLASASPRRREILEKAGLKFSVEESGVEESFPDGEGADGIARALSESKARRVAERYEDAVVIAADTVVALGEEIFGKPRGSEEAREMLMRLNGKVHEVITAFTILDVKSKKELTRTVETKVFFKKMTGEEIVRYVNSGEPLDKAGAYGIQGLGSEFIEKIEGDFLNVVGLPRDSVIEGLEEFGVKLQ
jgi:septum formation protein